MSHNHKHDHGDLMQEVSSQYRELFQHSEQGMYIYLDDEHKICNAKFAELLGYESSSEWEKMQGSFPDLFVADVSQVVLVSSYQDAMEKGMGSTNEIVWKKKDGTKMKTTVILVPVSFNGHLMALHFVSR